MFKTGEYVIYANKGVCKVEDVGTISLSGVDHDQVYYTLSNVYESGSKIYIPANTDKIFMRSILDKEEALELIDKIPQVDMLSEQEEKDIDGIYKKALSDCNCKDLIRIIKSLYQKRVSRKADGKKVPSSDEKYFRHAEDFLYGELAVSLHLDKCNVSDFITSRIHEPENTNCNINNAMI